MIIQAGDIFGPYTIIEPLSDDGGMSRVFLAHESLRPQYKAALKVQLTPDDNRGVFQDLLRHESQVLQTLRHPGIVHIFPLRIEGRVTYVARAARVLERPWYYAMEYLPGGSLDTYIENIKKYPIEWVIELFYQLVLRIHYIHEAGYAYCDLKPQNIMFRSLPRQNQVPDPILIDFGSAARINPGIAQLAASLRYSPPEVVLALERHDIPARNLIKSPQKIDIWALGAVLFEIVTGRPLINQRTKKGITTTIIKGELDDMRSQRHDVHPSLDKMLSQMLHSEPNQRPTTTQLLEAVEERIFSARPPRIIL